MAIMEKGEVVKTFLGNGYQLDVDSLNFFYTNQHAIQNFLEKADLSPEKPRILTLGFVNKLVGEVPAGIEELRKFPIKRETLTIEFYTKLLNKRFEETRKLLLKRLELVNTISLNRISEKVKKFSIIVMVREINKQTGTLLVEDQTGVSEVKILEEGIIKDIFPDEVIGLICSKEGSDVIVERIIWPDIPLRREGTKIREDINCLFISDIHMDSEDFNKAAFENFLSWLDKNQNTQLFVIGDISNKKADSENFYKSIPRDMKKIFIKGETDDIPSSIGLVMNNPSFLDVYGVKIFLTHGTLYNNYLTALETTPVNLFINLLKKRHLNPTLKFSKFIYEDDPFFLDVVPDVIVCGQFHTPEIVNYKGTTIISNGSFITKPIFWQVNLKTRETIKVDFTQK
jgi:DNA polymerase II small subunit/DNA polymerase delta subunit B